MANLSAEVHILINTRGLILKRNPTSVTCGKSFCQSAYLTQYQKIHSGEKPECMKCGKAFIINANLIQHQGFGREINLKNVPYIKKFRLERYSTDALNVKNMSAITQIAQHQ